MSVETRKICMEITRYPWGGSVVNYWEKQLEQPLRAWEDLFGHSSGPARLFGSINEVRRDRQVTYSESRRNSLVRFLTDTFQSYPIPTKLKDEVKPGQIIRPTNGGFEQFDSFLNTVQATPAQCLDLDVDQMFDVKPIRIHDLDTNPDPLLLCLQSVTVTDVSRTLGLSLKDIAARYMIEQAMEDGKLSPGQVILERSSGNTGVGVALMGLKHGHPVVLITTSGTSQAKIERLRMLGANVVIQSDTGCAVENGLTLREYIQKKLGAFYLDQHRNLNNVMAHFNITAKLIPDGTTALVVPLGTHGTLAGLAGAAFSTINPHMKVIAVDADGGVFHKVRPEERRSLTPSQIRSLSYPHGIQGMDPGHFSGFIPPLAHYMLRGVIPVTYKEALRATRYALPPLGYLGGLSSGATYAAIHRALEKGYLGYEDRVFAPFVDTLFPYLDIVRDFAVNSYA